MIKRPVQEVLDEALLELEREEEMKDGSRTYHSGYKSGDWLGFATLQPPPPPSVKYSGFGIFFDLVFTFLELLIDLIQTARSYLNTAWHLILFGNRG